MLILLLSVFNFHPIFFCKLGLRVNGSVWLVDMLLILSVDVA